VAGEWDDIMQNTHCPCQVYMNSAGWDEGITNPD